MRPSFPNTRGGAPRQRATTTVLRPLALAVAVALIAIALVPRDFQGHTHWDKVAWVPFLSPPVRVRDVVANVLLFVPLGLAVSWLAGRPSLGRAALIAFMLSLAGEYTQVYSHQRFPSATDLVCNVTGALVGARLRGGLVSRRAAHERRGPSRKKVAERL